MESDLSPLSKYDVLLQPLQIGKLTLRNRVYSTGHVPGYAENGRPTERYYRYQEEKAKGGIGLTIFGGTTAVSPEHTAALWNQLQVADDSVIPYLAEMGERIRKHGAAAMIQLDHLGRRMAWNTEHWMPAIAPSPIPEPGHRSFPREMDQHDIDRVISDFASAARRSKEAGLDGIQLSAAGPHIFAQFWSPFCNKRTDRYGGDAARRMTFSLEVLDAVRRKVGPDFVIGMRVPGDEYVGEGLAPEDCIAIAKQLEASGMVDFLDVYGGQSYHHYTYSMTNMNMSFPVAPYLHLPMAFRAEVKLPIFHAQRVQDLDTAARAVADGATDMVGMTRAHLSDPHIMRKLREGRPEDIRQCVGAAYCIDRLDTGATMCLHNPATGREEDLPHKVSRTKGARKKVVVIGGGPAGMEAARVCAERGHQVVLFEARGSLGGQLRYVTKPSWREAMSGIGRWLSEQLIRLDVDIRLGTQASPELVIAEDPAVVIVATGGTPNKGDFEGAELTLSTWEALEGKERLGRPRSSLTTRATIRDQALRNSCLNRAQPSNSPSPTGAPFPTWAAPTQLRTCASFTMAMPHSARTFACKKYIAQATVSSPCWKTNTPRSSKSAWSMPSSPNRGPPRLTPSFTTCAHVRKTTARWTIARFCQAGNRP